MNHKMRLFPKPFKSITNGNKTIELRLNDEKRSLIKPKDIIEFTNTEDLDNKIEVEVIKIHQFNSFEELYKELPLEKCGYKVTELDKADSSDMLLYYSQEKQDLYGVLGIEFIKGA